MDDLKQIMDAVAYLVASALSMRPVSWETAKVESLAMRKMADASVIDIELDNGKASEKIDVQKAKSPMGFLMDSLLNLAVGAVCLYVAYAIAVALFWALMLAIGALAIAYVVAKAMKWLNPEVPAPAL